MMLGWSTFLPILGNFHGRLKSLLELRRQAYDIRVIDILHEPIFVVPLTLSSHLVDNLFHVIAYFEQKSGKVPSFAFVDCERPFAKPRKWWPSNATSLEKWWTDMKCFALHYYAQCAEGILNKIATPINKTITGLMCMLQGFRICFIWNPRLKGTVSNC